MKIHPWALLDLSLSQNFQVLDQWTEIKITCYMYVNENNQGIYWGCNTNAWFCILGNHLFLDVNLHTLGLRPSAHTMSGECQIHLVSFHKRHVKQVLIFGPRIVDFKMNRLQLFVYQKELLISRQSEIASDMWHYVIVYR